MNTEQTQEILSLRSGKLTPKQIARKMGLKVSEVTAFLKGQAESVAIARAESGELAPVVQCLINVNCVSRLFPAQAAIATDSVEDPENNHESGFAVVTVTRSPGFNRFILCSYLVDYWCLGVKDASGPRKYNRSEYEQLISMYYEPFPGGSHEISLTEAQAIVFGAVEYAEKLGFKPHHDFEKAREHLGEWNGELKLEFGKDGKPFYQSGPYDNSSSILHTLNKSVGEGNYNYLTGMDAM